MKNYYFNINEVGIDEAGRGPLIGNVYAGAVIWDENLKIPNNIFINDSKKLTPKRRKIACQWIKDNVKYWAVGFATNDEIDKINILEATKLAMDRAIQQLKTKTNITHIIIDGNGWEKKFNNYETKSIIKGDSEYYSIACASILAKEFHDEHIIELCSKDSSLIEKYMLDSNMGYASKKHIEGIKKYGYTNLHRKSFKLKCL
jgi:ribonuclease HII